MKRYAPTTEQLAIPLEQDGDPFASQDIEIPMSMPSMANLHAHWRTRKRLIEQQRGATGRACALQLYRPALPVNVQLIRVAPRLLDREDNLPMSFKGIKDEIAEWLGFDDDRDDRARWFYSQQRNAKGRPRYQAARMIITTGHESCATCGAPLVAGRYLGPYRDNER